MHAPTALKLLAAKQAYIFLIVLSSGMRMHEAET
jgi:hypothetical protein